jgi:hypothetical protein
MLLAGEKRSALGVCHTQRGYWSWKAIMGGDG